MNTHIYINIHASFEYLNGKPNTQTGSSFPFGYCLDFTSFSRHSRLIPKREKPGKLRKIKVFDATKNADIVSISASFGGGGGGIRTHEGFHPT